jgi:hypothetical protein
MQYEKIRKLIFVSVINNIQNSACIDDERCEKFCKREGINGIGILCTRKA